MSSVMARTLTVQYKDSSHVYKIKVCPPRGFAFSDQASGVETFHYIDLGDNAGASESEPKDLDGRATEKRIKK